MSPDDPIVARTQAELALEVAVAQGNAARLDAARAEIDALVTNDPLNAELLLLAGLAAVQAGDRATAERAWLAAETLAPESAAPSVNLAVLYIGDGRRDAARAAAERAVARDPDDPRAQAVMAQVAEVPAGS